MKTMVKCTKEKAPKRTRQIIRDGVLFSVGGVGYYAMEVIFRGYSHWSMAICGGVCLLSIYHINRKMIKRKIAFRALAGAGIITLVEFICGCIVNLALGWDVWDYSHLPINFFGQICLPFMALWFALCLPVCGICSRFCGEHKNNGSQKSI